METGVISISFQHKKVNETAPSDSSKNDTLFTEDWKNNWHSHYDEEMDSVKSWAIKLKVDKLIDHSNLLFANRIGLPSLIIGISGSHIKNLKKEKEKYEDPTNFALVLGSFLTVISSFGQYKKN